MDDNSHDKSSTPSASLPKLRPYQLPAAEVKARDEKDAAERLEHLKEMRYDNEHPGKKHRVLRFFGWLILIALLTGGIGGAGWYFFLRQPMAEIKASSKNDANQASSASTPAKTDTKHYASTNFALEFDYPSSWVVTDSTAKLTITAPATKLPVATASASDSKYVQTVVTFQNRQATIAAFKSGNATAIAESEKITYTKPSSVQRANSYLSFLSYADSAIDGLDGVYVTGDNGYQVGQAIPQVDIAKADPLITVTFNSCSDSKCATPGKPATLSAKVWQDATFAKPIRSLLQSIIVQ